MLTHVQPVLDGKKKFVKISIAIVVTSKSNPGSTTRLFKQHMLSTLNQNIHKHYG
jgi:hypothetical protein